MNELMDLFLEASKASKDERERVLPLYAPASQNGNQGQVVHCKRIDGARPTGSPSDILCKTPGSYWAVDRTEFISEKENIFGLGGGRRCKACMNAIGKVQKAKLTNAEIRAKREEQDRKDQERWDKVKADQAAKVAAGTHAWLDPHADSGGSDMRVFTKLPKPPKTTKPKV